MQDLTQQVMQVARVAAGLGLIVRQEAAEAPPSGWPLCRRHLDAPFALSPEHTVGRFASLVPHATVPDRGGSLAAGSVDSGARERASRPSPHDEAEQRHAKDQSHSKDGHVVGRAQQVSDGGVMGIGKQRWHWRQWPWH